MNWFTGNPLQLEPGSTVAIIGGGPAGSFAALHLLQGARERNLPLQVVIFERRRQPESRDPGDSWGSYRGCPQCAGGISPRLHDALAALEIQIPEDVIQCGIAAINVRGNWKTIRLPVPAHRTMLSVYRGSLPHGQHGTHQAFDSLLLDRAVERGAKLIGGEVYDARYDERNRPVLHYRLGGCEQLLAADFAIFAAGVNQDPNKRSSNDPAADLFRLLQPRYRGPGVRRTLIFELEALRDSPGGREGELNYIECSTGSLELEMCSILPKRDFFTVSLIGRSVDEARDHRQLLQVVKEFLNLPPIRRALPPGTPLRVRCLCNPGIVVGAARRPCGQRAAAVGDMAVSRLYKDGILSAHHTARALAATVLERGVDARSLSRGYETSVARFRRDNHYARMIFFVYRWFFTSRFFSRVLYQAYSSELKIVPAPRRRFEAIFWAISSGDESYARIARRLRAPAAIWWGISQGVFVTLRNELAESIFDLDWSGVGRHPTAIPLEQREARRHRFIDGRTTEFECAYTIHLRAAPDQALQLLGKFGEPDRPFLNPRWVTIRRSAGEPLQTGCVIDYRIFGGLIRFQIEQQPAPHPCQLRYYVRGGFADGGCFLFDIEPTAEGESDLTVYLAFDYARGRSLPGRIYHRLFRRLFPEFIHEVLWNIALCEFKQQVEAVDLTTPPELINLQQL